jgi:AhpD family alkylhydroperoxidase
MTTGRANPYANFAMIQPLTDFANAAQHGLDPTIVELIKIRASQINGCAMCLHMHTRDAIARGETPERIFLLDAWQESPFFTDAERAVLAWTEALTNVVQTRAPDAAYEALQAHFKPEQQLQITLLIGAINAYNRLNVAFRIRHPRGATMQAA